MPSATAGCASAGAAGPGPDAVYTRCAHCNTVFSINATALRIGRGRVRCGACMEEFEALATLSEDLSGAAIRPAEQPAETPSGGALDDTLDLHGPDEGPPEEFAPAISLTVTRAKVKRRVRKAQGRIQLSVRAQNGRLRIEVSDSGDGIPAADLPHIFERFYRVDKARTREDHGSGLGLAIVKRIVELHDSEIQAASSPGAGARFWFDLKPLRISAAQPLRSADR